MTSTPSTPADPRPLELPAADVPPEETRMWVEHRATQGLADVGELVQRLRTERPTDALAALRIWDEATLRLDDVMAMAELYANVHPAEMVRTLMTRETKPEKR